LNWIRELLFFIIKRIAKGYYGIKNIWRMERPRKATAMYIRWLDNLHPKWSLHFARMICRANFLLFLLFLVQWTIICNSVTIH
jgi:hypothetical protein